MALKVGRAWAVKEGVSTLWHYTTRAVALRGWTRLCDWASRTRLSPVIKASKTVRRHMLGVLNAVVHRVTNASAEGINSQVQELKKRAHGYRNRTRFKEAIYFNLGGLDLYLFVILDIFSRYVVGWMVARCESGALASKLFGETLKKHAILPDQLTLYSDRGGPMRAKNFALFLADLGVVQSFGRHHVSDDNPYSEAQFKTTKYRPGYPDRFGGFEDARGYCVPFFDWYNNHHHHSGIGWMTPADVHFGRAEAVREQRAVTLDAAYQLHPERFVRKPPEPPSLPEAVWINPPAMNGIALAQ